MTIVSYTGAGPGAGRLAGAPCEPVKRSAPRRPSRTRFELATLRTVAVGCALTLGVGCSLALPAGASAKGALAQASVPTTGGSTGAPAISATLERCAPASDPLERSATFYGQMETIPGTVRMAMQIVVQERAPGDLNFHTLTAPTLAAWQRSETGVKIYKDVRQFTDLPAPAAFRALVLFRWVGEKGRVLKSAARHTAICRQPAPRSKPSTPAGSGGSSETGGATGAETGAGGDTSAGAAQPATVAARR